MIQDSACAQRASSPHQSPKTPSPSRIPKSRMKVSRPTATPNKARVSERPACIRAVSAKAMPNAMGARSQTMPPTARQMISPGVRAWATAAAPTETGAGGAGSGGGGANHWVVPGAGKALGAGPAAAGIGAGYCSRGGQGAVVARGSGSAGGVVGWAGPVVWLQCAALQADVASVRVLDTTSKGTAGSARIGQGRNEGFEGDHRPSRLVEAGPVDRRGRGRLGRIDGGERRGRSLGEMVRSGDRRILRAVLPRRHAAQLSAEPSGGRGLRSARCAAVTGPRSGAGPSRGAGATGGPWPSPR